MPDLLPVALLLVEHEITDLDTWLHTYAKYAREREQGGVRAAHVLQPDDNPHYVVIIHFFDTTEAAENFREFLRKQVWTSSGATPGLGGEPRSMILHEVDTGSMA